MKPAYAASFAAALICHALLLFGFKLEMPARPLPESYDASAVDVNLVAEAPQAPPVEAAPTPEPASTPEPLPTPEPATPEPTPEMSTPPPVPEATPVVVAPPELRTTPPPGVTHPKAKIPSVPGPVKAGGHTGVAAGAITAAVRQRSNPSPDYPEEARRLHQSGLVLLSVDVSAEGLPVEVKLKRGSGFPLLDQAAIDTVKNRWTFYPARAGPLAVESWVDQPIRFVLPK